VRSAWRKALLHDGKSPELGALRRELGTALADPPCAAIIFSKKIIHNWLTCWMLRPANRSGRSIATNPRACFGTWFDGSRDWCSWGCAAC